MSDKQTSTKAKLLDTKETSMFCEQVALILDSGIPIRDGVEALVNNYKNTRYADKFEAMLDIIEQSGSFYEAVSSAGFFPSYMVSMVRIGEQAGKLDHVMRALGAYYEGQSKVNAAVKNAVLYPTVLILMMAAVVAVLVIKVLPVFDQVFQSLGSDLSASGNAVMRFGMGAGKAVLILIGVILLALVVCVLLSKSKYKAAFLDFLYKVFPPAGRVREKIAAQRFASVISMMLSSGYPIEEGMALAPEIVDDSVSKEKILKCAKLMEQLSFADAVSQVGLFDEIHNKMISVGQLSGQTDGVMAKLADIYEEELDQSVSYMVSLIEPTLVAVVSVMVGSILLSVMLPLLGIISSII